MKFKSYSKINLGLWIKQKKVDGYHEIETVFLQNNNLYDDVDIEFSKNASTSIDIEFIQPELNLLVPKEGNLAYKAANAFFEKNKIVGKCKIIIDKKIPLQAGLGGGSSNAACVLKALNQIFDNCLSEDELLQLSNTLGSDVPFFIIGKTCLGKGRGEILKSLENNLALEIKIVKPEKVSISTKWAYDLIDAREFVSEHNDEIENIILALKTNNRELLLRNIFNDFEIVVFTNFPELINLRKQLFAEGFKAVGLCGSGSALFGIK